MASCNMLQVDIMHKLTFLQIHTYALLSSEPLHGLLVLEEEPVKGMGQGTGTVIDSQFEIGNAPLVLNKTFSTMQPSCKHGQKGRADYPRFSS
jgi:hypothetical protein